MVEFRQSVGENDLVFQAGQEEQPTNFAQIERVRNGLPTRQVYPAPYSRQPSEQDIAKHREQRGHHEAKFGKPVEEQDSRITNVEGRLEVDPLQMEALEAENLSLMSKLSKSHREYANLKAQYKKQFDEQDRHIAYVDGQLAKHSLEFEALEAESPVLKSQLSESHRQNAKLEAELNRLYEENENNKRSVQMFKQVAQGYLEQFQQANEDSRRLMEKLREAEARLMTSERTCDRLRSENKKLIGERESARMWAQSHNETATARQRDLDEARRQISDQKMNASKAKGDIESLTRQLSWEATKYEKLQYGFTLLQEKQLDKQTRQVDNPQSSKRLEKDANDSASEVSEHPSSARRAEAIGLNDTGSGSVASRQSSRTAEHRGDLRDVTYPQGHSLAHCKSPTSFQRCSALYVAAAAFYVVSRVMDNWGR